MNNKRLTLYIQETNELTYNLLTKTISPSNENHKIITNYSTSKKKTTLHQNHKKQQQEIKKKLGTE